MIHNFIGGNPTRTSQGAPSRASVRLNKTRSSPILRGNSGSQRDATGLGKSKATPLVAGVRAGAPDRRGDGNGKPTSVRTPSTAASGATPTPRTHQECSRVIPISMHDVVQRVPSPSNVGITDYPSNAASTSSPRPTHGASRDQASTSATEVIAGTAGPACGVAPPQRLLRPSAAMATPPESPTVETQSPDNAILLSHISFILFGPSELLLNKLLLTRTLAASEPLDLLNHAKHIRHRSHGSGRPFLVVTVYARSHIA